MSGAQHTPAPWDWVWISAPASGGGHLYIVDPDGRKIAACWGRAEEKAANARLMAAAPALLAALKLCCDREDIMDDELGEIIRAAIAQAEGGA